MYVIQNDSISLGDVICTFPGTLELVKRLQSQHVDVGILWSNAAAGDLFPHEKYGVSRVTSPVPNLKISIHDMVHKPWHHNTRHEHPTAQFLAFMGFPELSVGPVQPEIVVADSADTYDVLISPYILAELPRFWPLDRWQQVIDNLRTLNLHKIGVLCSAKIPDPAGLAKINPYSQAHFKQNASLMKHSLKGVEYLEDLPLPMVARMMQLARLVITVDSGPARLAHAAGIGKKHVLLCNNAVNRDWGTYPEATTIYTHLGGLGSSTVIAAARSALNAQ